MGKRNRIALKYEYNENWIGGTYYIQNLVAALNKIEDADKPALYIFCHGKNWYEELKAITKYPYLYYLDPEVPLNLFQRAINKLFFPFLKKDFYTVKQRQIKNMDLLFPSFPNHLFSNTTKELHWIADFQEHYLPHFFPAFDIENRKKWQEEIVGHGNWVVFSSKSAQKDFNQLYPQNNLKQYILSFAVTHQEIGHLDMSALKKKYALPERYIICCNQFWQHKNHRVLIDAMAILKQEGFSCHLVLTGKDHDYRNPEYFPMIKNLVEQHQLTGQISFLGFIPREDQLLLIQNAQVVVQPSLFEGWSTVIEDAKSFGCPIIASELDVHKEQLEHYGQALLFPPSSAESLASCIRQMEGASPISYDYEKDIYQFGRSFNQCIKEVLATS
jgi:glycosyltransferase involved in cell wall biosynthesis